MLVLLESGAASGGIGDNGVKIPAGKDRQVLAREFSCYATHTGMGRERSATYLPAGHYNFATVSREHADGSFVQTGKTDLRDTSGKECDSCALWSFRRKGAAKLREE